MGHSLGIDLGTTFVAAAVADDDRLETVPLGDTSAVAHAAVRVGEDGSIASGDAAARRAVSDPDRVARDLKRRLGDPTPVVLGGVSFPVTTLLGALLRDVLARAVEVSKGGPDTVVLTHPAHWGPLQCRALADVAAAADLTRYSTATEPEAAAAYHGTNRPPEDGGILAVYDLGGGTFDATVLRHTPDGTEVLGVPDGIERLGGRDFDDAVLGYVDAVAGGVLHRLDLSDARTRVALARLRQDCTDAKEALSFDTEATIPVFLPGQHLQVRLTREEFEGLIRVPVESTLHALGRTLRTADVTPDRLSAVLLTGGSAQIPLIAEMVSQEFGCPAVVAAHPRHAVALGAAVLARRRAGTGPEGPTGILAARPEETRTATVAAPAAQRSRPVVAGSSPVGSSPAGSSPVEAAPAAPGPGTPPAEPGPPSPSAAPYPTAGATTSGLPGGGTTPTGADPASPASKAEAGPAEEPKGPPALLAVVVLVLVSLLGIAVLMTGRDAASGRDDAGATPTASDTAGVTLPEPAAFAPVAASASVPSTAGTVPVGETPGYAVASPDGRRLYVAQRAAGTIAVVDTAVDRVVTTIDVPSGPPQYLTLSPDGTRAYVSVWDDDRTVAAVSVLDTITGEVVATVPMRSRPYVSAVSPDGAELYVPNHDSAVLSVVDTRTASLVAEVDVPPNPHWVELTPDGARAYVADHDSNVVAVVDTATDTVVDEVPVGTSPHSVAVHRSRPLVATVNFDAASVSVIDTDRDEVVATVPVGEGPQDVTWSVDGRFAYVTNVRDSTLSVVSAEDFSVTATIPTGMSPTSVTVLPDGRKGYVSDLDSGTLTVLDLTG
ncbi:40-residue YVTN family beta-propeller repeat-containing protein [Geodermatophilus amargosae]|uniref:40-residue YVTN family beta-propeller repeat-containing protein n=1 Tax=Geodermatophilus amargosae TaxID=1296565 RepID=A0A1I7CQT0_9ACTN|nr:Hsp70 family protein [Geodermatophilus amargosae]SFU01821.1 40-residue YVTN family beta-propeller repeat-containing protein [Geodermatophilus amargosae]